MGKPNAKGGRGGGRGGGRKMYIQNEDELALRNEEVEELAAARRERRGDSDDEDDEGGDEGGDDAPVTVFAGAGNTTSSATAKAPPKVKSAAGANANAKPEKMMKLKDLKTLGQNLPQVDRETVGMNRKEREVIEEARKKEEYMKRHLAGETVEAKKELAMLAQVRARREEARIKREAEGRAPGWIQESSSDEDDSDSDEDSSDDDQPKKAKPTKVIVGGKKTTEVSLGAVSKELAEKKREKALKSESGGGSGGGDDSLEKLSAIEIKKMNPNALKDALKARNLDIQGAKKDLLKRLLDHEAAK